MNLTVVLPRAAPATVPASASAEHHKLVNAAQQFEGMLLQEMLKPMKEHGFCEGDENRSSDEGGGGFADTLSSYGAESLATAIAKSGGLGIARRVVAQVEGEMLSHPGGGIRDTPPESQNNKAAVLKLQRAQPMN